MDREAQLADLHNTISVCVRCPLFRCRSRTVAGSGSTRASIVLVGEAPGRTENDRGVPFVGKAGAKLDEWLRAAGLNRDHLFITNILKCQPPENRFPEEPGPVETCLPYLHQQITLVQPLAIIVAGKHALQHLVLRGTSNRPDMDRYLPALHRRRAVFGDARIAAIYHPAFLLRRWNPIEEQRCIAALKRVREFVAARIAGQPAPITDLVEIPETEKPTYQHRLRLFGAPGEPPK